MSPTGAARRTRSCAARSSSCRRSTASRTRATTPPGGCPTRSPPPSAGCARPTGCAPAGAPSSSLRRLRLDEPAADRVAHELHAVAHAELAQQVAAVGLDGLLAEVEDLADLLVRVRLGDQLEDLLLARRERLLGAGGLVGHPLPHERALGGAG